MKQLMVADITSYLEKTGWYRHESWRDATIWSHENGRDLLVPPRDGLGDNDLRVRDIVGTLAELEQRPEEAVRLDIGDPADVVQIRTFPADMPEGYIGVSDLSRHCKNLSAVFRETSRYIDGVRSTVKARNMEKRVQVGAARPGSHILPLRVPVDDYTRRVLVQLREILIVAREVAETDSDAFGSAVVAGVSADVCDALSGFAGEQRTQPFDFGFRWAHTQNTNTVRFAAGTGEVLRSAARSLREVREFGELTVVGMVERSEDGARRSRIRGEVTTAAGRRRTGAVWVRFTTLTSFNAAVRASQAGHTVRAAGVLASDGKRAELLVEHKDFEVLDFLREG